MAPALQYCTSASHLLCTDQCGDSEEQGALAQACKECHVLRIHKEQARNLPGKEEGSAT